MIRVQDKLSRLLVPLVFVALTAVVRSQPVLIAPAACESLVMTAPDETGPWTNVDFENGTDAPIRLIRSISGGNKKEAGVLRPRYAERYWARRGTVFVAQDITGTCIAAYPIGKEDARVRIGDKPIRIRWNVPPNRLKTVIFPGFAVKPDRDEPYVDLRGVNSTVCEALNLWIGARTRDACGGPVSSIETDRFVEFDLSRPVTASGARTIGMIRDDKAEIHVFVNHDHERRTIRSVQDLEVGEQLESERVEFGISVNGVPHTLLAGPWGPGEFGTRQKKAIHGEGTSKALLKRVSETVWDVQTPNEALARLWQNADTAHPIDLGLYRLPFHFRFELQSETAFREREPSLGSGGRSGL